MKVLSNFIILVEETDHHPGPFYRHWCPACKEMHTFAVDVPFSNGARWSFDGNAECPTFSPSMNISHGPYSEDGRIERCHYFIQAGQIKYCDDCTHELRGQTVTLPAIPDDDLARYRNIAEMQTKGMK